MRKLERSQKNEKNQEQIIWNAILKGVVQWMGSFHFLFKNATDNSLSNTLNL